MTSEEIISAMKSRLPVIYNGVRYDYIDSYILRYNYQGEQVKSVALMDKKGNSLMYALASKISPA